VLIERRREDDPRVVRDPLEHLEPAQLGHLDVQKHEVGLQLIDHSHGIGARGRFANALHPGDFPDQLSKLLAGERLVLRDQCAHAGQRANAGWPSRVANLDAIRRPAAAGMEMRTANPVPNAVVTMKVDASPYRASIRCRTARNPNPSAPSTVMAAAPTPSSATSMMS